MDTAKIKAFIDQPDDKTVQEAFYFLARIPLASNKASPQARKNQKEAFELHKLEMIKKINTPSNQAALIKLFPLELQKSSFWTSVYRSDAHANVFATFLNEHKGFAIHDNHSLVDKAMVELFLSEDMQNINTIERAFFLYSFIDMQPVKQYWAENQDKLLDINLAIQKWSSLYPQEGTNSLAQEHSAILKNTSLSGLERLSGALELIANYFDTQFSLGSIGVASLNKRVCLELLVLGQDIAENKVPIVSQDKIEFFKSFQTKHPHFTSHFHQDLIASLTMFASHDPMAKALYPNFSASSQTITDLLLTQVFLTHVKDSILENQILRSKINLEASINSPSKARKNLPSKI